MAERPLADAPGQQRPAVELVQLPLTAIDALADGDLATANRHSPVPLTRHFSSDRQAVWKIRSLQLATAPDDAGWVTGAIVDSATGQAVGCAGFHGPPDSAGMVELGYSVDPVLRRRGYARAALELLLGRAAREPSVCTVRATISPDNEASRNLILQYGFQENGSQWDEEDGLEIIFEVAAGR
ncbi:GNAT family N-acetyltransferase [Arthrobacter sp. zg-Y820]|uniref:GNAT family N-acetyltransferase n=1 Tax=unclassified Arthrobacter TaxID=235627 RepID=UPI002541C7DD|nr:MULTISPECIES: GNAT family N-acetyltransferase [unclassified Arthrobacter]MCC9197155.1 GNAT family N-acetyltransferase [Arthrobacter sp. zg-Y820]MDK1280020.1 GNAT family N-acetyltransferase [Arthrobacter sp. zg.Y820]WIB09315.1 GNAT family N-acetyltransferase [Arthrobacter sp. zg-Y820]